MNSLSNQTKDLNISPDDKLFSLIAHLSSLFGTIILPIVLYVIFKSKSKFVAFNALQALYYQIVCFIFFMVILFGSTVVLVTTGQAEKLNPKLFSAEWLYMEFLMYAITGTFFLLQGGYALIIGIMAYKGQIAKYILLGGMAYDKVYSTIDKTSFNLNNKSTTITPNKKQSSKGMI